MSPQYFDHCDDEYSSIRVQTTLNHIQFAFLPEYQPKKKMVFQECELKTAFLRETLTPRDCRIGTSSGRPIRQIARLVAIVAKI